MGGPVGGWMDGWMNGRMEGATDGQIDRYWTKRIGNDDKWPIILSTVLAHFPCRKQNLNVVLPHFG